MKLTEVFTRESEGAVSLVGVVEMTAPRETVEVYFKYPDRFRDCVADNADPFVPALLVPCLMAGEDLEIAPPISARLLRSLVPIQDIYTAWWRGTMTRVEVKATAREAAPAPPSRGTGLFFSLGVDSFYSLLKDMRRLPSVAPPVTHLIFMRGLETPIEAVKGDELVEKRIAEVSAESGKELILGETNIRTVFPLDWSKFYHGAGLAAVALSLSEGLGHVLIAGAYSYRDMQLVGGHPLLDPLWSTERLEIIHDGSELTRAHKIADLLAREPLALRNLRVCIANDAGDWNCGLCPKCIRTMISFRLAGALDLVETLPNRLPEDIHLRLPLSPPSALIYLKENIELGKETGLAPELVGTLERALRNHHRRAAVQTLLGDSRVGRSILFLADIRRGIRRWLRAKRP